MMERHSLAKICTRAQSAGRSAAFQAASRAQRGGRSAAVPVASRKRVLRRSQSGITNFIEICAGGLFTVILALLGMDICMAIFGASINDHACRDAVRAAATADTRDKALAMAQTALKAYVADGKFITTPQLLQLDYQDWNGNPPVDTSPYVSVTCQTIVSIPAPLFFFGATFIKDGKAQFTQQYTFPIVKAKFINYPGAS
ncbi:MAG: hypothetical protein ACRD3W_28410 [Terriglobales bacterium]